MTEGFDPTPETKICIDCGQMLPITRFRIRNDTGKRRGWCKTCGNRRDKPRRDRYQQKPDIKEKFSKYQRQWYQDNKPRVRERARERSRERKQQVMAAYGGKCRCCGVSDLIFLTIDHVDGGGSQHLREMNNGKRAGTYKFYTLIVREGFPLKYQILCWNCNAAKYLDPLGCPHQR